MEQDWGFDYGPTDDDGWDHNPDKPKKKKKKKKSKKKTEKIPVGWEDYHSGWPDANNEQKEEKTMNQFQSMEAGSSIAGLDLSKIGKYALVSDKGLFGKKPKIVVFFHDRPDIPAVNFELQNDEEAQAIYNKLEKSLNQWAEEANSSKVRQLEKEIEVREKEKQALIEQTEVLMTIFNKFKDMMQLMEDETKTSELVASIKGM